ncbi:sigma-70 family RNA polymerase sigma factor [Citricoccus sp. NR2]|uniref:sigma-70 family RNA polymerase sigma factor n=1 Tax=Citricoccus sp. NR2 TaxID=3004095 RepID=UPI002FD24CC5
MPLTGAKTTPLTAATHKIIELNERNEVLDSCLDCLPEREAGVLSLRYGLATGKEMTLEEVGQIYGVTRERIRQIQNKALKSLREADFHYGLHPQFW